MTCPESDDGLHKWTLADVTCTHDGRCKAWICPCGAWRRVELQEGHEVKAPGPQRVKPIRPEPEPIPSFAEGERRRREAAWPTETSEGRRIEAAYGWGGPDGKEKDLDRRA